MSYATQPFINSTKPDQSDHYVANISLIANLWMKRFYFHCKHIHTCQVDYLVDPGGD